MKNHFSLILLAILLFTKTSQGQVTGTFIDARDGKTYKTVKIGSQIWMAENLAYKVDSSWAYNSNPENVKVYGYLYNWEAAKKACPPGWHVPTNAEWMTLNLHLGGFDAAIKLKEKGSDHWQINAANNESGFTALPGGVRSAGGAFGAIGEVGGWWCSNSHDNAEFAWFTLMSNKADGLTIDGGHRELGLSVRCVKDK